MFASIGCQFVKKKRSTDLSLVRTDLGSSFDEIDLFEQRLAECGNDLSEPLDATK